MNRWHLSWANFAGRPAIQQGRTGRGVPGLPPRSDELRDGAAGLQMPAVAPWQVEDGRAREGVGSALAWSAARLLGGQAATLTGLSSPDAQVLLASDPRVAAAQDGDRYAGGGPGAEVFSTGHPVVASYVELPGRWPEFAAYLQTDTPYRSVMAVPAHQVGVLTVYFTDPVGAFAADLQTARMVAQSVWSTVVAAQDSDRHALLRGALQRRHVVGVATGMLAAALHVGFAQASEILIARASVEERTLEDLAVDLFAGVLAPDAFRT